MDDKLYITIPGNDSPCGKIQIGRIFNGTCNGWVVLPNKKMRTPSTKLILATKLSILFYTNFDYKTLDLDNL